MVLGAADGPNVGPVGAGPSLDAVTEPPSPPSDLADDEDIEQLVREFYRRAAVDDVLGPVFAAAEVDWVAHIPRVTQFWSWQLMGGRRYDGRPLRSHERVNDLVPFTDEHYDRWLELFTETLHERWSGPVADRADERARRMARSMRRVLAGGDEQGWSEVAPDPDAGERRGPSGGLVLPVALGARRAPSPPVGDHSPGRRPAEPR